MLQKEYARGLSKRVADALARSIHEGSSRKRANAKRDGHSEVGDWLCRLRRCLSRSSDGDRHQEEGCQSPAVCRRAERRDCPSQPRIRACSRSFMNNAG